MTFKSAERILETSTTAGTGTYALMGAPAGYNPVSKIGANNYGPFVVTDGVNWEAIIGQYLAGPDRLTRDAVIDSSNGGAAVDWAAGARYISNGWPAWLSLPRTLSKSVAGGAGTTVLTQNEQRNHSIEFTGALTGNRVVELDATPWPVLIYNNTSGAYTLTVRVTGQTGVAVPQGGRALVYCDGTDVRDASVIPVGTVMLFVQTTAPVGWVKSTTHNDKALRVVSGTVGSGGATAFTSVFGAGKLTGAKTLAIADIPSHAHVTDMHISTGGDKASMNSADINHNDISTSAVGGGGSHDHPLDMDLAYVDAIIATRS